MATTKFTQHSKESELKDLNTERGHGIRLSNSPEGRVTRRVSCPVEQFREAGRALHWKAHSSRRSTQLI
jgi:hypothetical protein